MQYVIPTRLETERLTLRMFRESDWRDLHEYYGDEECTTYTSGRPLRDYETWQKLAALVGHWELRAYGSYAVEEKASRKVTGVVGLDYPLDWPEPEIQWGLAKRYWGEGFASEAVRAVKRMAAQYVPSLSLISLIHPKNSASIALAQAVGAHLEREHVFRDGTWLIFRHRG
jgi:RimJ/RimL family protein N-acetyltransferase